MRRHPDWPSRMESAVEARKAAPFQWGSHDCALAACDVAMAMTGVDAAAPLRGRYDSELSALYALRRFLDIDLEIEIGDALAQACAKLAADRGLEERPVGRAARGDFVLVRGAGHVALGVVHFNGRHVLIADKTGWRALPLKMAVRCWGIP